MNRYLLWTVIVMWLGTTGFAFAEARLYSKALKFAKSGQEYFAFMQYNNLLRNYPESKYRERALFATGEYYYRESDLKQAETMFKTLLSEHPDSKEHLYTLAYLLSIADKNNDRPFVEDLEKQIINLQQVSFIFRESKEIAYRSPLYQNYKAVIHIDKIEFFVEGKLFAKVSY